MNLSPPRRQFIGSKQEAQAHAEAIIEGGGLAWIEPEYGSNMSGREEYMGHEVLFFLPRDFSASTRRSESKVLDWLEDALSRNQIVHEVDRARARELLRTAGR